MKSVFLSSLLVVVTFTQTFCGSVDKRSKKEDYSYSYSIGGCTTEKSFKSKTEYCKLILDDVFNNFCARTQREEAHKSNGC